MDHRPDVEVWKNAAAGKRYFIVLDRLGHETTRMANGGRTFTLTSFDRQINQERAATPQLDMFRNGSFVLVKSAKDTEEDEIRSANSLTDNEILSLVHEVMAGSETIEGAVFNIDSEQTLHRIYEALVLSDAAPSIQSFLKEKVDAFREAPLIRKEIVTAD